MTWPVLVLWLGVAAFFKEGPRHGYAALVAGFTPIALFYGPLTGGWSSHRPHWAHWALLASLATCTTCLTFFYSYILSSGPHTNTPANAVAISAQFSVRGRGEGIGRRKWERKEGCDAMHIRYYTRCDASSQ